MRHNGGMSSAPIPSIVAEAVAILQGGRAVFGYLHGSRASAEPPADSDVDIAAFFEEPAPQQYDVLLPPGIDLLVLNTAPLEVAGRVAVSGHLLFERDPAARVRWEATTRKVYFDELPRIRLAHAEFLAQLRQG